MNSEPLHSHPPGLAGYEVAPTAPLTPPKTSPASLVIVAPGKLNVLALTLFHPLRWFGYNTAIMDYYRLSVAHGYNLLMLIAPQHGTGFFCLNTGCILDLNEACSSKLKMMSSGGDEMACKSACDAFGDDQYYCNGTYITPSKCKPPNHSELFQKACPRAESYMFERTNFSVGLGRRIVALLILGYMVFRQWRKADFTNIEVDPLAPTKLSNSFLSSTIRRFSFAEIRSITNNFDNNLVIGVEGFGKVYKGCIDNGATTVAMKWLDASSHQGVCEFKVEI
ncbi:LOW QUALITY PROTEIN: hypothetical protein LguiB_010211 [Lonicera macranthoides]